MQDQSGQEGLNQNLFVLKDLRHPCLWFPPPLPRQAGVRVSRRTRVVLGPAKPGDIQATAPMLSP